MVKIIESEEEYKTVTQSVSRSKYEQVFQLSILGWFGGCRFLCRMVRALQSNGTSSRYHESTDGRSCHICEGKLYFLKSDLLILYDGYFRWVKITIKVDVDELEEIAMNEGVQAMPTFAFFKNGEKLNQVKAVQNLSYFIPLWPLYGVRISDLILTFFKIFF